MPPKRHDWGRLRVLPAAAVVLACCLAAIHCRRSHQAAPVIEFTRVPPANLGSPIKLEAIEGRVTGAAPGQNIVLFAKSGVWWVQPFAKEPLTPIQKDSGWKNSTHPGMAYAALLVAPDYSPPSTMASLPEKGGSILAVASVPGAVSAGSQSSILHFSGYEWDVRQTPSDPGGSKNRYDPGNAWTDGNGYLHLRVAEDGDSWTSAEVSLTRSLGYGSYRFVVQDVSTMEPSHSFAISTWDDAGPAREMNIEISRWGEPTSKNAQFVVQPYFVPANSFRFEAPAGVLTYSFRWEPGRVSFQSSRENGQEVARHVFTSGVPSPGDERIHLNHYIFINPRNPFRHGSEVIIEKFEYLP